MKTLIVKFEYLEDDDLRQAIDGLFESTIYYPNELDYEYTEDDETGNEIVRYRRTCQLVED